MSFFANYLAIFEKDLPKGSRVVDMRNRIRVSVRGVTIDVSNNTINQIIYNEIFVQAHKISNTLPLRCLIKEICRQENVRIIRGVDN